MSGMGDKNRETPGVEAPGPIDRALDRDRDDKLDLLEGNRTQQRSSATGGSTAARGEFVEGEEREIRVPVVEEQLQVGKREVELGEVEIRRRVVEEEQSVPVTLRHEEVTVEQVGTPSRPLRPGEEAFQEGTIRVAVRGEEAVVAKEAVVTGEVVIEKEVEVEQRQVSDTVRRTEVDFDEHYTRARSDFEQDFATRASSAKGDWTRNRTFEHAEPNYRAGYMAGTDQQYSNRRFEDVEPELRRNYESGTWGTSGATSQATGTSRSTGGETWEHLREEVRHGFQTARNRAR